MLWIISESVLMVFRKPKQGKSLSDVYPEIAKEWDFEKNPCGPEEVCAHSGGKVWWICSACGYRWQTSIASRSAGHGCPKCALIKIADNARVPKSGESLQDRFPEYASEWDYSLNGTLTPSQVKPFSNRKVWWKCPEGHSWEAIVSNRIRQKSSCPYCSGRLPLKGQTDLASINPELAAQWDYEKNGDITPEDVTRSSGFEAWWKCENGHSWKRRVADRANGAGCPYCGEGRTAQEIRNASYSGRYAVYGESDVFTTHPELKLEWNYERNEGVSPETLRAGSSKKVWWKCSRCGHEWIAPIRRRTLQGSGCPQCASELRTSFPEQCCYYYLSKYSDFDVINRESYAVDGESFEIDVFIPALKTGIEYDGSYWHSNSSERELIKDEALSSVGIRIIRIKEGSKNVINDDVITYDFTANRTKNLEWAIGSVFELLSLGLPGHIDIRRDGSDIQASYIRLTKENSLAILYPAIASEWCYEMNGGLNPLLFSSKSNKRVWWECSTCGNRWQSTIVNRTNLGNGCPICGVQSAAKKLETPKEGQSLADLYPQLATEWDYQKNALLTPNDVNPGSTRRAWWICGRGHSWEARIQHRVNGSKCPYCSGRLAIPGETDLQTLFPGLCKEWDYSRNGDLSPSQTKPKSSRAVWWKCEKCGHSWQAVVYSRTNGNGCPKCHHHVEMR